MSATPASWALPNSLDRIERLAPALTSDDPARGGNQWTAEHLKIHHRTQTLQRVTRRTERLAPVRKIKENRLPCHHHLRRIIGEVNQIRPSKARVF